MRFFTRRLYDTVQHAYLGPADDGFESRCVEADQKWNEALKFYQSYLREHEALFIGTLKELKSLALHDSRIVEILRVGDSVELILDTRHSPLSKATSAGIRFLGVRDHLDLDDLVGQDILYEEIYFFDDGTVEFSALCNRSEFRLHFTDLRFSPN